MGLIHTCPVNDNLIGSECGDFVPNAYFSLASREDDGTPKFDIHTPQDGVPPITVLDDGFSVMCNQDLVKPWGEVECLTASST